MERSHKFWFWNVLILQMMLVVATFWRLILDGQRYLFMDSYDGMRNYFAYHNFINQGETDDFFLFNNMNYPFGDYITYTDNTPLLAVIVKWFSENIYNISHCSLSIFHWFYVFSIVLSSVFLYLIGKHFKQEVLDVTFNDKNIFQVLDLSIEEGLEFFKDQKDIIKKLKPLDDVGLGYIKLGQSSSTLSGGEAQRVKLASFLGKERITEKILFIFDEPTTGLHFHDIRRLLDAFNALVEKGHTVIVVEHNMEVIKNADWLIDLGPEGGADGGHLVFEGTPEDLIHVKESYTGKYLKEKLEWDKNH